VNLVLNLEHDKKILNLQISELNKEIRKYTAEYLPFIKLLENKKFVDESHKKIVENKFEILLGNA
jgi:valyl-tRNA synthetase